MSLLRLLKCCFNICADFLVGVKEDVEHDLGHWDSHQVLVKIWDVRQHIFYDKNELNIGQGANIV